MCLVGIKNFSVSKNGLAETPRNVVLGQLMVGTREDLIRGADFDEITQMKVGRTLRNPRGLLHGVGNDGD